MTPIMIDVQDAIGQMQYEYALAILLIGVAGVLYVLWNNFVRQPGKVNDKYIKERYGVTPIIQNSRAYLISDELDTLAIMPALYLAIVGISYFTGFTGV